MKAWRLAAVLAIALSGTFALSGAAGASRADVHGHGWFHHGGYTCTSGPVPAGNYRSVLIAGICTMPSGHVNIWGDLTIAPGALLDAVTPGDPTSTPAVPATVYVGGNVWVLRGAALLLGCSPNISCAPPAAGITFDQVQGSLTAVGAQGVVLHDVSVGGDVSILGGGGGSVAASCAAQNPADPTNAALEPWSEDPALAFTPVYTDFEDGSIGGSLRVIGLNTCWLGTLRNWIDGSASFVHGTFGDPDAMEIGNNLIWGNLGCWNNSPAPQWGDSGAAPDLVNGWAFGQCGFTTVLPNPPTAGLPPGSPSTAVGVNEHLVVSMQHLQTYTGTLTTSSVATLPGYPVTTSGGDSIFADLNSFTLSGSGLTGTATYAGGAPGQAPGQADLGSTASSGWSHFVTYDTCTTCSFDGQTGPFTFRTYGATWPGGGHTQGVFLITSGGAVLDTPTSPVPGLATLAGWGTFSGSGNTVTLVEHLGFG